MLILPSHPDFWDILYSTLPPNWKNNLPFDWGGTFAVNFNTWLLEPISRKQAEEYVYGGEFDAFDELENWYKEDLGDDCVS